MTFNFGKLIHFVWGGGGTRWCSWLRHCATSRKVAVSIPVGVVEIFFDLILPNAQGPGNDSDSNRKRIPGISPGGKGGRSVGLITLPPSCA